MLSRLASSRVLEPVHVMRKSTGPTTLTVAEFVVKAVTFLVLPVVIVLPSRNEGFPLVLLEAMAAGRDVLVRDHSATRLVSLSSDDFFTGDNDLLPQLQRKLARPLPPVRRYELAAFDWDLIAVQTCEVYATATAAPAPLKA